MLRHPDLDWTWYTPAWRGNRARAQDGTDLTPMRVELRPPTVRDAEALADAMSGGTTARDAEMAYIRQHVRSIEHFEWSDGTPIRTADDLLARRDKLDPELWRELTMAALNLARLEEGLVGKSGWGSGFGTLAPADRWDCGECRASGLMTLRCCEGPPAADPVFHPAIPPELALPLCPMRVARDPDVTRLVTLFARCERYRSLPRQGGLWRQPARVMAAFDVMRDALRHRRPARSGETDG